MLCQLPDDLEETSRGKSIIDAVSSSGLDVEVDKSRSTPGRYELTEPHTYTWEVNGCDFPVTSSHMVGNFLYAGDLTPKQGSALCYHLGAIDAAPDGPVKPSWVWNIDEFSDDKSIREMAWMVRGLYQGYVLNVDFTCETPIARTQESALVENQCIDFQLTQYVLTGELISHEMQRTAWKMFTSTGQLAL